MFEVAEQEIGGFVRSGCARTIFVRDMQSLIQIKSVSQTIVQALLSNTEFIVLIGEIEDKLVDKTADKLCLRNV